MGAILALLAKGAVSFGTKMLVTLASEKMIEWAFFKIADSISKSTKTPHDDEWVQKVKDLYSDPKPSV